MTQQWKPIESAPKDGTPIIIACIGEGRVYDLYNGHIEVVQEDEQDGAWGINGGEPFCSYVGRPAGEYFCCWLPGKEWEYRWKIGPGFEYTHWMPLPAAPGAVKKPQERVAYTDGMGHLHWVNGRKVGVSLYVAPIATVREARKERPEFEAWLWGDKTDRDPDDMNKPEIDAAWRAWQARANLEAGDKDE